MAKRRKALTAEHPTRDLAKAFSQAAKAFDGMSDEVKAKRRTLVLEELRRCKALLDKEYPAPKRKVRRRKRATIEAELRRDGWPLCLRNDIDYRVATYAGVRVVEKATIPDSNRSQVVQYYVTPWIRLMRRDMSTRYGYEPSMTELVAEAKRLKSATLERRAMEVRATLR